MPDFVSICLAVVLIISIAKESRSDSAFSAFDHIVLGAADLKTGVKELEDLTGVQAEYGGKHPHLGTENALINLGEHQYLEVLAPVAGAKLDASVSFFSKLPKLTPVGFGVSTPDAESMAQMLKAGGYTTAAPRLGSRLRPDGSKLEWKTFDIETPQMEMAPFFIEWSATTVHPSKNSPAGCKLVSIELTDPHAAELQKLMKLLKLSVNVQSGTPAAMRATLNCLKGKIVIGE